MISFTKPADDAEMAERERIAAEFRASQAAKAQAAAESAKKPVDETVAQLDAEASGRAVPGIGKAGAINMGIEGLSPGQSLAGEIAAKQVAGPRGALQVEDSLAERMAPGAQGRIAQGLSMQSAAAQGIGEATSDEEKQVADWYKRNREDQSKMLSKSMTDYQKRRDAIDEFTPRLLEAADRIKNTKQGSGSFWGDMKDGLAYQSMVAMHLVSDDHLGVAKATQDMVNNQLNKERFELEKARTSYDALSTTLGQFRALAGDAQLGDQLYRKASLETAAMQIEELAHGLKSQTAKDAAFAVQGQVLEEAGKLQMQIGQQTFRQASIQDARVAKYNNDKATQQDTAKLGAVGAQLLKLGGGDPEKAATIAVRAGMPAERVTAALAAATGAPAATGSTKAPATGSGSAPVATRATAGAKAEGGSVLSAEQRNAIITDPRAWAAAKKPDESYNKIYLELERKGETAKAAEAAYALAEGKLLAKGRGNEISKYRSAVRNSVAKAMVGSEEKLDLYTTAAALKGNYDTWNNIFQAQAKATGKSTQDVANAWLQAGREGVIGSGIEYVAKTLSVDPDRLRGPLKSMGLAGEREVASQVFLSYTEAMKMANAHKLFGVISDKDKGTAAELFSGKYSRWSDLGAAIGKADVDGRAAINYISDRAEIPGDYGDMTTGAMKKAIVRAEVRQRIESLNSGMFKAERGE